MGRKQKTTVNFKYDLGCWMTVYNRPELLIDATTSILKCKDLTGIKFVIADDCSSDPKILKILNAFINKLHSMGNTVDLIVHKKNYGKEKYHETLKECFKGLSDCRYIMPLPPDFEYNPYIFRVARKCFKYIDDVVKVICFYKDSRNLRRENKVVEQYFIETQEVDWGPAIFQNEFCREFFKNILNMNSYAGTGTTHCIMETAREKGYKLYKYKESLCEHMGNNDSSMNPAYRKANPLNMADVNLNGMPRMIMNEIESQSPVEFKPCPNRIIENKRICVVKSCGIGNIIYITPTIIKLKEMFPDSAIDLLVENNAYKKVLEGWSYIDNIYIDGDQMSMPSYDIIINGIPSLINIDSLQGNKYTGEAEWYKSKMHEVHANIKILKQVGMKDGDLLIVPETDIPKPKNKEELDKKYPGTKYIGISAGFDERSSFKNWGYDKFAKLIDLLNGKYKDHTFLIFGVGKDEKVYEAYGKYGINKTNIINCVDELSIQETGYLISKCKFMVANDTGLAHVASAVGTRCFTIFGMTPPLKAIPYKYGVEVSLNLDCSQGCYYEKRWDNCQYRKCLEDLSPEYVYDRITDDNEYDLGIMIATYNRYELLICTLSSLLTAFNNENVKISFVNDGSNDIRINKALFDFSKVFKGNVSILNNKYNRGRIGYPETLRRAWNQLYNCKYVLTMPDDAICNTYFYEAIKKSYKYFKSDVKCITYFRDSRMVNPYSEYDKEFFKTKPYNKFFDVSSGVDGFACLFENKFLKSMNWHAPSTEHKTNFWRHFHWQLKDYNNLLYKESLCSHVGNISSVMWANKNGKRMLSIEGTDLNLWEKPFILTNKTFEYSPEWYSDQYHKRGAYNLPKRKYVELQNEWENLGYKKRYYQVLDDMERFVDMKEIETICEAGCHHGKSVFWMRERYPDKKYDAFDFSKVAIDWCKENNPFDNIKFKLGDVRSMPYKKKFDLVTCLDVGEHLPEDVYFEMIEELKRISGKYILWYVGRTKLEEHINLRSIEQQKKDLKFLGKIVELPLYHLLIKVD